MYHNAEIFASVTESKAMFLYLKEWHKHKTKAFSML